MSGAEHERALRDAARRLEEISSRLGSEQIDDAAAVKLAREAAQIAADVGAIAAEAARAVAESDTS